MRSRKLRSTPAKEATERGETLSKKRYVAPELVEFGTVFGLTQVTKTHGIGDGVFFDEDGEDGPIAPVPIGGSPG